VEEELTDIAIDIHLLALAGTLSSNIKIKRISIPV